MEEDNVDRNEFECARCGKCCEWEGYVRVSESEIDAIAAYLNIPLEVFIREYTRLTGDRTGLSLIEKPDGSCYFYSSEEKRCLIQEVKPEQCRTFPYKWAFPGWESHCAGSFRKK